MTTVFRFDGEDDTLGMVLVTELDRMPSVSFVRYDSYLNHMELQTVGPEDCLRTALLVLRNKMNLVRWAFETGVYSRRVDTDEELVMDMSIELHLANMIRRVILAEVETMAIDMVHVSENTSLMLDEVLAHRLGQIPVLADPDNYATVEDCDCEGVGCPFCQIRFTLDVVAGEDKDQRPVYSEELSSVDTKVVPGIPIVYLRKKERLGLVCFAKKNRPSVNAKWCAATVCTVNPKVNIALDVGFSNMAVCPTGVFIEQRGRVVVFDPDRCTMCGECKQQIEIRPDYHRMRIESVGQMSASKIFVAALTVIEKKLARYTNHKPIVNQ